MKAIQYLAFFFDLWKVFDPVGHKLNKLEIYNIYRVTNNPIKSFVTNLNQRVKINNIHGSNKILNYGVLQWDILGVLHFIIHK